MDYKTEEHDLIECEEELYEIDEERLITNEEELEKYIQEVLASITRRG